MAIAIIHAMDTPVPTPASVPELGSFDCEWGVAVTDCIVWVTEETRGAPGDICVEDSVGCEMVGLALVV